MEKERRIVVISKDDNKGNLLTNVLFEDYPKQGKNANDMLSDFTVGFVNTMQRYGLSKKGLLETIGAMYDTLNEDDTEEKNNGGNN